MKKLIYLMCCAAMTIVSMTARAQYKAELSSDPVDSYLCATQNYSADEIASALGIDTVGLKALLSTTGSVYLKVGEDRSNACTGNPDENVFWMNKEGAVQTYSQEGTCWYAGLFYSAEEQGEEGTFVPSSVTLQLGQMPNVFSKIYENSVLATTLYIVKDDKSVSFDVTLTINAAQKPNIPDAVTNLADLTIVKEYEMILPFVVNKSYEGKTVSVQLEGLYEALGTEAAVFDEHVSDYTYTNTILTTKETEDAIPVYSWNEVLEKPEVAAGGAWFGRYYNMTDDGSDDVYVGNAPMAWGSTMNTFYTQQISLNDGEFSITTGQYPGALKAGDVFSSNLYIINGDKAALVKLVTDVYVPEMSPFEEMTKVGEEEVAISAYVDDNYATKPLNINMAAALEALGCDASDISELFAFESENVLSNNHTESSGGFYFQDNGFIGEWASNATFFVAVASLPDGKFTIGQRSGKYTNIEDTTKVETNVILAFADKYYNIKVKYTVIPKPAAIDDVEMTLKSTESIVKQIVPNSVAYNGTEKTALDLDYIESLIGTRDFKLMSDTVYTNPETGGVSIAMGDKYTCTPAPGFWFGSTEYDIDGENCVAVDNWGTSCSFGLTYAEGVITWYEIPDTRSVGQNYTANLYLINEETLAYIKYVVNVSYVDEIVPDAEVVSHDSVAVYVDEASKDAFVGVINTKKVCEALGITDIDAVKDDIKVVFAKSPTITITGMFDDWNTFTPEGYVNDDESKCAFAVSINIVNGELAVYSDFIDVNNQQMDAVANIGLEYAGKRVMFKVTFTKDDPTAIAIVGASQKANGAVYTLSGVKTNENAKGVLIIDGKKFVKK